MALARGHDIGLEMTNYGFAALFGKNRGGASRQQKNTHGNELEQPFHNLLLFVSSNRAAN